MLRELGDAVAAIADRAGPSVVGIRSHHQVGSGVVIEGGYVLTNAHNAWGGAVVVLADGTRVDAEPAGIDGAGDLAVLRLDGPEPSPIAWDPGAVAPRIGTPVVGLANPGGRGLRATLGFVAATGRSFRGPHGRRIPGGFEHTALAPPGSSGGPVVDAEGGLVGINTRRLERGFYIAQTAGPDLASRVETLRHGDLPQPKRLGVGLAPAEVARRLRRSAGLDEVDGLLVRSVEEGSPAAAAGVLEGDVLVAAAGQPVGDTDALHAILAEAGESLEITVVRVNEELTLTVLLD
ncbi:MAG: PDZ domain-containing protein [Actinobacteria bacterium]|nr:MAG: PDZ domain-containing protein [Actinomycetota bacterium]